MALAFLLSPACLLFATFVTAAQPASFAIPPLQWLNLANTFTGDAPPPLAYASIGYDPNSNTIIIFGGEQNGIPQATTYLLNLATRSWSRPSPPPSLTKSPPARSRAISGVDFAVNNRHGFVVIGGKGAGDTPLSDVWEFDFIYSFWSEVKISPSALRPSRWGAVGGIDPRVLPVQDTVLPGPNNTFYLAGGMDNKEQPLSQVWALSLSGTLSPNLPDSVSGSWASYNVDAGKLPSPSDETGAIIGQRIISVGSQYTRVVDAANKNSISPESCPAPRIGMSVVPNLSTSSTGFATQAFVILGLLNATVWDDGGNLNKGEVDVLEVQTGSWSRVLPAGNPSSGNVTFPGPREGAAAVALTTNVSSAQTVTDTYVFGGRSEQGYLDEIWLLRAYDGSISPGNPTWKGYGDGKLQSGISATGSGVVVEYLTECAKQISTPGPSPSSPGPGPGPPGQTQSPPPVHLPSVFPYDTSVTHKILAPLSVALILPACLLFMLARAIPYFHFLFLCSSATTGMTSIGLGLVGFILSFTSIQPLVTRPSNLHLTTVHGQAGVVLFALTYVILPLLLAISWRDQLNPKRLPQRESTLSGLEKTSNTVQIPEDTVQSRAPSSLRQRGPDNSSPDHGDTETSVSHTGTFFVTNRPRRASTGWLNFNLDHRLAHQRNLSDMGWLERRRSVNAVDEMNFAQTDRTPPLARTPATVDRLIEPTIEEQYPPTSGFTWKNCLCLVVLFHASLLALCAITLVALWKRAPRWAFAIFLAWIVIFYVLFALTAWYIRNRSRLKRARRTTPLKAPTSEPDSYPFPTSSLTGSSAHHLHMLSSFDGTLTPHIRARSPDIADVNDDEDVDEDTRQARIEQEMERRDVSIITLPKSSHRPLRVTNLP